MGPSFKGRVVVVLFFGDIMTNLKKERSFSLFCSVLPCGTTVGYTYPKSKHKKKRKEKPNMTQMDDDGTHHHPSPFRIKKYPPTHQRCMW